MGKQSHGDLEARDPAYQERVRGIFESAPFMALIGAKMDACGPGWCESHIVLRPEHLQQNGVVHAGVQSSLADHTAGASVGTLVQPDQAVLTASFSVQLMRAAKGERLRCRAEVVKSGRTLSTAQAYVYCGSEDAEEETSRLTATIAIVSAR